MWQEIVGHDDVVNRFRQSLAEGRLASSYVFLGPPGVGKRTLAVKLAKALLCQMCAPTELEACGNCDSCRQAEAGTHPDLSLVSLPAGKSKLPVDLFLGDRDHRNQEGLCHEISMRPMLGRRRVAVIDDADYLSIESSNCLLKTLEEPPPGAVLILLATSRSRLLPTILSRAQVVRFSELSPEHLSQLLVEHGLASDSQHASQLALISQGSLQRARDLGGAELWELRNSLLPQLLPSQFNGSRIAKEVQDFVNASGKDAATRRQSLRTIFQFIADLYSKVVRASCQSAGSEAPREELSGSDSIAQRLLAELGPAAQDVALAALDRCIEAETEIDRNANLATLVECWIDDLSRAMTDLQVARS